MNTRRARLQAYASWSASENYPIGQAALVAVATAAVDFRILEASVGAYSMAVFVRNRDAFTYAADETNGDGAFDWRPLGRVLTAIYCSLFVDGLTLVVLWLVLQGADFGGVGPILIVFAAVAIFCGLAPYLIIAGRFRDYVDHQATKVRHMGGMAESEHAGDCRATLEIREHVRNEFAALNTVTPFPFRKRLMVVVVVAIPTVLAIVEVGKLFG